MSGIRRPRITQIVMPSREQIKQALYDAIDAVVDAHWPQPSPAATPLTDDFDTVYSPARVSEVTGLSLPTLWRLRRRDKFPEPIELSPGRVGWRRSVVVAWLETRESGR